MNDAATLAEAAVGHNRPEPYDVEKVRQDFPILQREVYGQPLVYLDSAASAQKPRQVIEAVESAYQEDYSNVHRGVHFLSQRATDRFEASREAAARFINAASSDEIIFTRGGTESINLVAASYGRKFLREGDEIVISHLEHHSNIVPWQMLRDEKGLKLKVVPVDDDGNFLLDAYAELLGPKTRFVAITHMSNALGKVVPAKEVIRLAHERDIPVLLDGCQAVSHQAIDVQDLDADFYVFSGHKLYGPTGVGVLYGKMDLLDKMPPYQGGGEMISSVTFEESTFKPVPHRFEAGTPAIVQVIGLGAALQYVEDLGIENIAAHEAGLLEYAHKRLSEIDGLRILGSTENKASIVSFTMDGAHAHDIGTIVDRAGVAVRAGHHCAQPLMDRFDIAASARASFGLYNTFGEVDALAESLNAVTEIFG